MKLEAFIEKNVVVRCALRHRVQTALQEMAAVGDVALLDGLPGVEAVPIRSGLQFNGLVGSHTN